MSSFNSKKQDRINQDLLDHLLLEFALEGEGIHGINHWRRVARNARLIANHITIDTGITDLFAYFHDSKREHDGGDPGHGDRAADFILDTWNKGLIPLERDRMLLLCEAVSSHDEVRFHDDPTIGACMDADRLDLGRCGIIPDPLYLNHGASKHLIQECLPVLMRESKKF